MKALLTPVATFVLGTLEGILHEEPHPLNMFYVPAIVGAVQYYSEYEMDRCASRSGATALIGMPTYAFGNFVGSSLKNYFLK